MEHIEYEVRVLEINVDDIKKKLEILKAKKVSEAFQRRYLYDFKPVNPDKWIRLRTDGDITTLTIKDVRSAKIDGTHEMEIVVDNFEATDEILNELGYKARGIQENKRIKYDLDGVEIDIDTWPKIPPYLEIEGKSEEEVYRVLKLLEIPQNKAISLNTQSIYKDIYGIDLMHEPILSFSD